ncbi:MAG: GNAT family N-acetyltransferase [Bacteroidota bacterium]|nr:GNAT family N-acetyltransferase [Bacteroidota bacterium]
MRALQIGDAEAIARLRSNDQVNQFLDRPPLKEISEAHAFIEKIQSAIRSNQSVYWAISLKTAPEIVGTICYWNIVPEKDRAEIGYELMPEFQGKGIMEEALKKVLEYGLRALKLKAIVALTHPANIKSIRLLEKNQFVPDLEGTFISKDEAQDEAPFYLYLPF